MGIVNEQHILLSANAMLVSSRARTTTRQVNAGYSVGSRSAVSAQVSDHRMTFGHACHDKRVINANSADTTGSEAVQEAEERTRELGTIRVVFHRSIRKGKKPKCRSIAKGADLNVVEKAMKEKAISHGTSLLPAAKVEKRGSRPYCSRVIQPVDEHPYAIFTFYYRSKGNTFHPHFPTSARWLT